MAKPKRLTGYPNPLAIRVNKNPDGRWIATPPDPEHGANVRDNGTVDFNVETAGGCWVYTTPTNAFQDEPSNGCLKLNEGTHDEDLASPGNNTTITYYVVDPGQIPPRSIDTGPYSIKSGSQMPGGAKKAPRRGKRRPAPKKKKAARSAKKARGGKEKAVARRKRK